MRFFLEITFVGTRYKGWQVQPRVNTIQAEINKAISTLQPQPVKTIGCGRTDTGVHAKQFFLHFDTGKQPHKEFIYKINRILPNDIAVKRLIPIQQDARSRQDALERTYEYRVHFNKDPFLENFSYYFPYKKPRFKKLSDVARLLKTFRDFKSLSKTDTQEKTTRCNIYYSNWKKIDENNLLYTITADHFLRGMVRQIVGAMLMIGTGKMTIDDFTSVMKNKGRFKYVMAVPGCGLSLVKVSYPYL